MLFNSGLFFVFLPCVWLMYKAVGKRGQNALLLLASYTFYGCWDWRFLSLLWISTGVDYVCGLAMARDRRHKRWFLVASLLTNLGILGVFKYCDFFLESAARLLEMFGFQPHMPVLGLVLPVGISFYTFQTMAYSIDVYRGKQEPTPKLLSFALYVAYFPQLVAGPIERSTHLLPEIERPRDVTLDDVAAAIPLCVLGYFKKVFLADGVAPVVNGIFDNPGEQSAASLLLGMYLFALQIYGDFSGYSDIARGVSRLFGIRLSLNFRQPYLSANITDFWRRWHMSLSSWLRDYLYIPLGGNRKGTVRTYCHLMITMLLGGLWHGACGTFVIWGGLHGLYLSLHKLMLRGGKPRIQQPPQGVRAVLIWSAGVFLTFNLVSFTWVFFRAETVSHASTILVRIVTLSDGAARKLVAIHFLFYGAVMLLLDALCWFRGSEVPFDRARFPVITGVAYGVMIVGIVCIGSTNARPFIYFQF